MENERKRLQFSPLSRAVPFRLKQLGGCGLDLVGTHLTQARGDTPFVTERIADARKPATLR